ncbi:CBM35 domain-containing protein [Clostridium butyricum]|uniref:CBM35 domain-containing protein n=1 Tax=Clostridium butyricum TaxID=1492 RepID=UPI002ABE65A1|nr:CBM35 domain-containing protein [Clostridium butyricum]
MVFKKSTERSGYSGSGYVTGFDNNSDYIELNVNVPSSGTYYLNVQYASQYGDKYTKLIVNNSDHGDKLLKQSTKFTNGYLDEISLNSGNNKLNSKMIGDITILIISLLLKNNID